MLRGILFSLLLYCFGVVAYLAALTAAALQQRPEAVPPSTTSKRRFVLIIPAHNEEHTLPHLLKSIGQLEYPLDCRDVVIIADNCTDATATTAQRAGVTLLERHDTEHTGKGYALEFGISWVLAQPGDSDDAILLLDADSEIDAKCLSWLDEAFTRGALALQCYYTVSAPSSSTAAALRYLALSLYHYIRPLGRERLRLSAGLRGNGMAFTRACLAFVPWQAYGLTEDIEQHIILLRHGIRVAFVPQAVIRAEMPHSFQGAASQNRRWERGRLLLARQCPHLLWEALTHRQPLLFEAAVEQLIPPLSICSGMIIFSGFCAALTASRFLRTLAAVNFASLLFHVVIGLRLARVPRHLALSLFRLPSYMLWKWWIWLQAAVRPVTHWQRTPRQGEM